MVSQVVLPPEGLVADVARVGSLVRVGPLVDQEVVGFGEMSSTELTDKFLFGLGGQPAARWLSVRGDFAELRGRPAEPRQLGQVGVRVRVLLRGGGSEVGEVEARPVFVQRGDRVGERVFRVEEVRQRQRGKEPGVHQTLRGCLAEGGA